MQSFFYEIFNYLSKSKSSNDISGQFTIEIIAFSEHKSHKVAFVQLDDGNVIGRFRSRRSRRFKVRMQDIYDALNYSNTVKLFRAVRTSVSDKRKVWILHTPTLLAVM